MKVLWLVNIVFPYPAKKFGVKGTVFGGWLNGLADNLKNHEDIELAIATVYRGNKILKCENERTTYFLIPGKLEKYSKKQEIFWKEIINDFKPDLVHIHGTEYPHGFNFINANENKIKTVVSIQGLVSRYADVYTGNLDIKNIKKNYTFRNFCLRDNMLNRKSNFEKRGAFEKEILKKADIILGRTFWDYANVKAINPNVNYKISNETLRREFYNSSWNINNVDKYTIFTSQANYPIKGLHYLLETIKILKYKYPNVKLYIAGADITNTSTFKSKILLNDYAKYIKGLIKKLGLKDNIEFTGPLNADQMKERFLKSHVFVLPSSIENSSNSLGEAMLLGMPCVASNTGGTMDMLEHKKEGFLYPYTEPAMCAEYIAKFFEDDELAIEYGKNANKIAAKRHDKNKNVEDVLRIYKELVTK